MRWPSGICFRQVDRVDDVMAAALAGLIAGLAVAMPLGAIGTLLINEGMTASALRRPLWRVAGRFVGLTALNPATAIHFVALAAGLGHALAGAQRAVAFVFAVFTASIAWQLVLAGFGTLAAARLPARARQITGLPGYLVVLACAARLALS